MIRMDDIGKLKDRLNVLDSFTQNLTEAQTEEADTVRKYRGWAARRLVDSSMSAELERIADQEAEHSRKFSKMVNLVADIKHKILDDIEKLKREEERKKSQVKDPNRRYGR